MALGDNYSLLDNYGGYGDASLYYDDYTLQPQITGDPQFMDYGGYSDYSYLDDPMLQFGGDPSVYMDAINPSLWDKITTKLGGSGDLIGKLGSAGINALSSYLQGGQLQKGATSALDELRLGLGKNERALAPYILGGAGAYSKLQGMAAQPTPTFTYDPNQFAQSNYFRSIFEPAQASITSQMGAQGMYGSGNMANALLRNAGQVWAQYAPLDQQMQQQNYMNLLNANAQDYSRMAGLAGTGMEAVGKQTALTSGAANAAAGYQDVLGQYSALGTAGMGNAGVNALSSLFGSR